MEIIVGGRQTGRTKKLIQLCFEAEQRGEVSYIVCINQHECWRVNKLAQELGTPIPFPISYQEFIQGRYSSYSVQNLYVDNVEMLVSFLGKGLVKAMTVTKERDEDEEV